MVIYTEFKSSVELHLGYVNSAMRIQIVIKTEQELHKC